VLSRLLIAERRRLHWVSDRDGLVRLVYVWSIRSFRILRPIPTGLGPIRRDIFGIQPTDPRFFVIASARSSDIVNTRRSGRRHATASSSCSTMLAFAPICPFSACFNLRPPPSFSPACVSVSVSPGCGNRRGDDRRQIGPRLRYVEILLPGRDIIIDDM